MQHQLVNQIIKENRKSSGNRILSIFRKVENPNGQFYNNDTVGEGLTNKEVAQKNKLLDKNRGRRDFLLNIKSLEEGKIRYFSSQLKSLEYNIPSLKNQRLSKHYTEKIKEKRVLIIQLEKQINELP